MILLSLIIYLSFLNQDSILFIFSSLHLIQISYHYFSSLCKSTIYFSPSLILEYCYNFLKVWILALLTTFLDSFLAFLYFFQISAFLHRPFFKTILFNYNFTLDTFIHHDS